MRQESQRPKPPTEGDTAAKTLDDTTTPCRKRWIDIGEGAAAGGSISPHPGTGVRIPDRPAAVMSRHPMHIQPLATSREGVHNRGDESEDRTGKEKPTDATLHDVPPIAYADLGTGSTLMTAAGARMRSRRATELRTI